MLTEAKRCYLEAIRIKPSFSIAWSNLAGIFKEEVRGLYSLRLLVGIDTFLFPQRLGGIRYRIGVCIYLYISERALTKQAQLVIFILSFLCVLLFHPSSNNVVLNHIHELISRGLM